MGGFAVDGGNSSAAENKTSDVKEKYTKNTLLHCGCVFGHLSKSADILEER